MRMKNKYTKNERRITKSEVESILGDFILDSLKELKVNDPEAFSILIKKTIKNKEVQKV